MPIWKTTARLVTRRSRESKRPTALSAMRITSRFCSDSLRPSMPASVAARSVTGSTRAETHVRRSWIIKHWQRSDFDNWAMTKLIVKTRHCANNLWLGPTTAHRHTSVSRPRKRSSIVLPAMPTTIGISSSSVRIAPNAMRPTVGQYQNFVTHRRVPLIAPNAIRPRQAITWSTSG